jgi:hypothetical protein
LESRYLRSEIDAIFCEKKFQENNDSVLGVILNKNVMLEEISYVKNITKTKKFDLSQDRQNIDE